MHIISLIRKQPSVRNKYKDASHNRNLKSVRMNRLKNKYMPCFFNILIKMYSKQTFSNRKVFDPKQF